MAARSTQCYAVNVRFPPNLLNENRSEIKDKLHIYFQSKQGGGCNVEYVRLLGEDVNGSWYRVAFFEQSGVSYVLSRSDHVIFIDGVKIPLEVQGCQVMSSSVETPPSVAVTESPDLTAADIQIETEYICGIGSAHEKLQDDPEEDEKVIEVTGLKLTKDNEVLKLCFENPRISEGGEIEMLQRDNLTPDAIKITFPNPSAVTSVVTEKEHKSGVTMKVKLITKKKHPPLSIMPRCLFLKGIPDGCTTDYLKLFLEYTALMDEEPMVQYGEKPGTAICTFSRNIPDLDAVIGQVSKKKIKGVSVKAEKVQQPCAILVQGVSQDLESVELYFDNKKKSGGGGVREVQPGPMVGQAIVCFEDWKVVRDVLAKCPHKLGGIELLVEAYHDFLGRLNQVDAPTPHTPKPVTVQVQKPIMVFLYGKGKIAKTKLLKELAMVKASLQWPDGSQKSQAKLEPVIDDSQRQSWLNWNKEAVDVLTNFMKGYKTARVPVPQSLWKDAADQLQKMTTTCSMIPNVQNNAVTLVGEQTDVDVTESIIQFMLRELQRKADYDAEQAKEDIYFDTQKLQLFTLCGIKQEIEKSYPALKITVFNSYGKTGINLDGIRKTIKDVELYIRRMMDSLEKTEFKAGSIKVQFVQQAPDKIHEVLGSQNIRAACIGSDDGKITIYGVTSIDVRNAKAYIDNEIGEDTIAIKGRSALAVIQGHNGKKLLSDINNQRFVVVCVSRETARGSVRLAGFKRNLIEAKIKIMNHLQINTPQVPFINHVKWKFSTSCGMEEYDEEINAMLEEAYLRKKLYVTLDFDEGQAIIDLQQMQATLNGHVVNVHRVDLMKADRFETPSNWIPMKQGEITKMVALAVGSNEYTAVETKFRASVGVLNKIIEIQRVQNQDLMMQYQARRTALENRLNRTNIEMVLYHGTDEQTAKKISMQGFNRSFCGKNATAYGYGTYFAVAASYSAHPQYARPNATGIKHIFMTNVLVGDYITGSHGMITPPNNPQSPGELYDSVVNDVTSPGIYVIFHDAQAYPDYLIKFR